MFSGFFDANSAGVGVEKESYAKIATSIQLNPENILYITAQPNGKQSSNSGVASLSSAIGQ